MSKIDGDFIGDVAAAAVDTAIFGPPPGGGGGGYPLLDAAVCVGGLDDERFGVLLGIRDPEELCMSGMFGFLDVSSAMLPLGSLATIFCS